MYTFLINADNSITASLTERIMQRSKLVDSLHFLADTIYSGVDMTEYTVLLEYKLPVSKSYKTEILKKSTELYKNKLEYKLPFDTNLTSEAGDIEFWLTFSDVEMTAEGETIQHVRKVGPGVVHIIPISNWADVVPDEALSSLDQRLIELIALNKSMYDQLNINLDGKADNIKYQNNILQLTSNGKEIGNAVEIAGGGSGADSHTMRVVPF
ncbi:MULTISPECIES: hypothetical protein [Faecalibacterium]|jgi:hypothetical protein|uniref:hypothetical protein n=1 Tax=Faecalibacterium TaxID=216851 RepID=UPI000E50CA42|nr:MULTISPECIES: hypothetical protein [Faecalibacterium]RHQ27680.1 hypothetical protein DWY95_09015 [Faecalibacterium sp. AF28-13AC]DAV63279.1 MAG TPA: hypothetical protein [Caudoviricetes sp.]